MDIRRPARNPNHASRRNLFSAPARRPNPHASMQLSTSSLHIPAEEADPKDDFVERDGSGNYKVAAPTTNLKAGAAGLRGDIDEEAEHENQMIALYGKRNEHWDTAGLMNEMKVALQSSLERKVSSLQHDKWMFEGEGKSKG